MLNLNPTTLSQVTRQALADAAREPRWVKAIIHASAELADNPWIERSGAELLIASPSGTVYSANGVCQCDAYAFGIPCWHRAAARLVMRHDEQEATLADAEWEIERTALVANVRDDRAARRAAIARAFNDTVFA